MDRRKFLSRLIQSSSLIPLFSHVPLAFSANSEVSSSLTALPRFLDTLLPADSTPSATQLGVDKTLVAHAKKITNYSQLLAIGCRWLDKQSKFVYGKNFSELSDEEAYQVVTQLEQTEPSSNEYLFFDRIKSDSFTFYYAHPASWQDLGIASPPQPLGYPGHNTPPRHNS